MPRTVRNFWCDVDIDGYREPVGGGPKNKEGGMFISLKVRDNGAVQKVCNICCTALGDDLKIIFYFDDGSVITKEYKR